MPKVSDEILENVLGGIIADGFNRSLGALEDAGAIDRTKMNTKYKPGSEYYDLVTEQIAYTAKHGAKQLRQLFAEQATDRG